MPCRSDFSPRRGSAVARPARSGDAWLRGAMSLTFQIALGLAMVFASGLIRGFTGFGLSIAAVPLLSLIMPPTQAIPIVLLLQLFISLSGLRGALQICHWPDVRTLAIGALIATPLGVWALARLPAAPVRIAIAVIVFGAVFVLGGWLSPEVERRPACFALRSAVGPVQRAGRPAGSPGDRLFSDEPGRHGRSPCFDDRLFPRHFGDRAGADGGLRSDRTAQCRGGADRVPGGHGRIGARRTDVPVQPRTRITASSRSACSGLAAGLAAIRALGAL